jgi:AraC family transcriptional regulator
MQADIVSMPAFTVVGMKLRTKAESNQMAKLWSEFVPRSAEIKAMPNMGVMYGVMHNYDEQSGEFDYIACVQTHEAGVVPQGMTALGIPQQTYAAFAATLPTEGETYGRIASEWLPHSGYRRAHGPEFELYGERFNPSDPNAMLHLYIPVAKVEQPERQETAVEVF